MKMLDLAKFEKVAEDKHTTKMRHEDGHEMTILHAKLPKIHREQLKRLKMAKGGKLDVESVDDTAPENQPDQNSQSAASSPPPQSTAVGAANIQGAAAIAPPAQANPLQQQAQGILSGEQQQIIGAKQQAAVDAEKARQMVPNYDAQVKAEADRKAQLESNTAMIQKHTGDFDEWMAKNGKPDPQHFGQTLPAAQKVSTALGLLIGGFSGGFSGTGNNPAMSWLKDQQEKDIQSQLQEIGNHKTVLGAYQQVFNNKAAAIEAARISDNNKLVQEAAKIRDEQGTQQAQANFNAFAGKIKQENDQRTQTAAGYLTTNPPVGGMPSSQAPAQGAGQASASPSANRVLSPDAEKKYQQVLYDPTKTPQQKAELQDEYLKGVQVDKAIAQIDQLYPQLAEKSTMGGYLANKINPHITGGLGLVGAEALTGGGGGGLGAIPVGMAGAAVGEGIGHAVKQGLTAMGGQQEQQYQTARASLMGYIGSALQGVQITPTEIGDIADKFTPVYSDSAATIKDKKEKLIEKLKTLAKTGALKANGMTAD